MFEISQKRQAFRIQIRNKQIKNLFSARRKKYISEAICNRQQWEWMGQQQRQMKCRIVGDINQMLRRTWECRSSTEVKINEEVGQSGWAQALRMLSEFESRLGSQGKQEEYEHNKNGSNGIDINRVLTGSVEQVLVAHGEHILKLVEKQITEEECLGSTEQQQQVEFYCKQVQESREDMEESVVQLQVMERVCSIVRRVRVHDMGAGCTWMVRLLWGMLMQAESVYECISRCYNNNGQQHRYTYLSIVSHILNILNTATGTITTASHNNTTVSHNSSLIMEQLQTYGIEYRISQLIQYLMQYDTLFKHELAQSPSMEEYNVGYKNVVRQLHMCLIQLIIKYQHRRGTVQHKQQQQCKQQCKLDIDQSHNNSKISLHEHYVAYGLYMLSTLSTHTQHDDGYIGRLYDGGLEMVRVLLAGNVQLPAKVDYTCYPMFVDILNKQAHMSRWMVWNQQSLRILQLLGAHSQMAIHMLVHEYNITDTIHAQLSHMVHTPTCACVGQLGELVKLVSVLLGTTKKSIIKVLYVHPLWSLVFDTLQHNPIHFMPLYNLFLPYFACFGPKVILNHMHLFLSLLTTLDIRDQFNQQIKLIQQLLVEVYELCANKLTQHQLQTIHNLYSTYGVLDFITE